MTVPELIDWIQKQESAGATVTVVEPTETWLPTGPTTMVTVVVCRRPPPGSFVPRRPPLRLPACPVRRPAVPPPPRRE